MLLSRYEERIVCRSTDPSRSPSIPAFLIISWSPWTQQLTAGARPKSAHVHCQNTKYCLKSPSGVKRRESPPLQPQIKLMIWVEGYLENTGIVFWDLGALSLLPSFRINKSVGKVQKSCLGHENRHLPPSCDHACAAVSWLLCWRDVLNVWTPVKSIQMCSLLSRLLDKALLFFPLN